MISFCQHLPQKYPAAGSAAAGMMQLRLFFLSAPESHRFERHDKRRDYHYLKDYSGYRRRDGAAPEGLQAEFRHVKSRADEARRAPYEAARYHGDHVT